MTLPSTNPHSGPTPTRIRPRAAGGADVAERLAREGLAAHDREHADHAGDDRDERPDGEGDVHGFAFEEAGGEDRGQEVAHDRISGSGEGALVARQIGVLAGAGDDQHAPVDVQDVDVVAVELAEHIRADDLLGGAAGRAPGGEVDDAVHHAAAAG